MISDLAVYYITDRNTFFNFKYFFILRKLKKKAKQTIQEAKLRENLRKGRTNAQKNPWLVSQSLKNKKQPPIRTKKIKSHSKQIPKR